LVIGSPGRSHQANHAENVIRDPRNRAENGVGQVEFQPGGADLREGGVDAFKVVAFESVGAGDGDEMGHLCHVGGHAFHFGAKALVAHRKGLAHTLHQCGGHRHHDQEKRQKSRGADGGDNQRPGKSAERAQAAIEQLPYHLLDGFHVADDFGLQDSGAGVGVVSNRKPLQLARQGRWQ